MEPRTRHMLAIDMVGDFEKNLMIIKELEKQNKSELRYLLQTKQYQQSLESQAKWKEYKPKLQIIKGSQQITNDDNIRSIPLKDLQTFELGDLCLCCLETPGHTQDSVSYVVTHVTPESTKIPFVFTGQSLEIGGCGKLIDGTAEQMFYSLQKLINLPNETLMFCSQDNTIENLKFGQYIEPENPMIASKLKMSQQAQQNGDFTVPSKMMDERLYNPFIRCAREDYYSQITGENDPIRIFAKLRKLRDSFNQ